jgi:simple sugar transport system ATP-binding protein
VAELSEAGLSVIFISSELEEVLRLAQRVVVMRDRKNIGELDASGLDVEGLINYIAHSGEGSVAR